MPRFFFHIDDGAFIPDHEGTELPNLQAARGEAVKASGAILIDLDGNLWKHSKPWIMNVTDEASRLLFTLKFSAEVPSGEVLFVPKDAPREASGS